MGTGTMGSQAWRWRHRTGTGGIHRANTVILYSKLLAERAARSEGCVSQLGEASATQGATSRRGSLRVSSGTSSFVSCWRSARHVSTVASLDQEGEAGATRGAASRRGPLGVSTGTSWFVGQRASMSRHLPSVVSYRVSVPP